jgi:hypothetical protein
MNQQITPHQIVRFSLVQTAKVAAALYFVLGLVGVVVMLIAAAVSPAARAQGFLFIVLAPFLYAFFGFIFVFVGCWLYNLVARFVGGIEFTLTETRGDF